MKYDIQLIKFDDKKFLEIPLKLFIFKFTNKFVVTICSHMPYHHSLLITYLKKKKGHEFLFMDDYTHTTYIVYVLI